MHIFNISKNKIVKMFLSVILSLLVISSFITSAQDINLKTIHLFYSETCPHCKKEIEFLEKYLADNENVVAYKYEVSEGNNTEILSKLSDELKADIRNVPFTVIGKDFLVGYTETNFKIFLEDSLNSNQENLVQNVIDQNDITPSREQIIPKKGLIPNNPKPPKPVDNSSESINIPLVGKVNPKELSLPLLTVVIGLLDGFNPCAMWTLLFLISLLLGMEDRLKMWILGIAFIITSGLVYFLFLAAWLNVFLFVGYIAIIRYIIGIGAIGIGLYYLKDYMNNKDGGCKVTSNSNRREVLEKLKNITQNKNFILALVGIILLAIAINAIELLCSAGLPAIYTNVLAMNELPKVTYYAYLLLYIVFFMLDDLIVFAIAMITLKTVGIESKYASYSHLIGGIITVLIGLALIFNPGILTGA